MVLAAWVCGMVGIMSTTFRIRLVDIAMYQKFVRSFHSLSLWVLNRWWMAKQTSTQPKSAWYDASTGRAFEQENTIHFEREHGNCSAEWRTHTQFSVSSMWNFGVLGMLFACFTFITWKYPFRKKLPLTCGHFGPNTFDASFKYSFSAFHAKQKEIHFILNQIHWKLNVPH